MKQPIETSWHRLTQPPWLGAAVEAVFRLAEIAPAALAPRFGRALERISRMNGADGLEAALLSFSSTPFIALLDAYRADLDLLPDDPAVIATGEGAVLLYLHVRIHDDLIDEPGAWDRGYLYAAELASSSSDRAFALATSGSSRFFSFREEMMHAFLGVAAWELDVYRAGGGDTNDIEWTGRKFLPMAIPLGALAIAAQRDSALELLERFVSAMGRGLQMANDALNIAEDHTHKRASPLLRWLYQGGRASPGDPGGLVRAALLGDPALDRALFFARQAIDDAIAAARELDAEELSRVAEDRLAFLDSIPSRLFALTLRGGAL